MNRTFAAFIAVWLFAAPSFSAEFNSSWTPKPLVDTNPSPKKAMPLEPPSQPAIRPDAEAMLKPAEPFISSVEKQLYIQPASGVTLVQRLNHLQAVLFGEPKYQDAGLLLSKLAEVFPQEAARAQVGLASQLQHPISIPPNALVKTSTGRLTPKKNGVIETYPTIQSSHPVATYAAPAQNNRPVATYPMQQPTVTTAAPKKKRFWNSQNDDWDDFKNDSFFNDHLDTAMPQSTAQPTNPTNSGSALRSLGNGMTGLAMLAGSLAGNYYSMKRLGGMNGRPGGYYPNNYYPYNTYNNGYFNNGMMGYSPYGNQYYGYPNYNVLRPYGASSQSSTVLAPGMFPGLAPGSSITRTYPLY